MDDLHASVNEAYNQTHLKKVSAIRSGVWLYAVPTTAFSSRLGDEAIIIAAGLRLVTFLCDSHKSAYIRTKYLVAADGSHGIS